MGHVNNSMTRQKARRSALAVALVAAATTWGFQSGVRAESPKPEAVDRAREQVKMLDDIYKTAVVLITDKYVEEATDLSAGSAAMALFDVIDKKGWHRVRLVDATGDPYAAKNVAKDDFEKQGIERLRKGEAFVDTVVEEDGKPYLRALTPIPVVMQKCTLCHPHYADVPQGQIIGALSYRVPIK